MMRGTTIHDRPVAHWHRPHWHRPLWAAIAALLIAPAVAMRVTKEVAWTPFDFAVAAALLIGGGLAYEAIARHVRGKALRRTLTLALLATMLLIWAQGAVGILS